MALASIKIDKDLLNLSPNMRRGLVKGLEISGDVTQTEIKKTRKFKDRTSRLRTSILRQPVDTRSLFVLVVATVGQVGNKKNPAYGNFLNDGTKYIKAMRFMEDGLDKASNKFERIFKIALDKTM